LPHVEVIEVPEQPLDVLVVGAGLSGLSAAWRLHGDGYRIVLCEATDRVGGAIVSRQIEGFLCEAGPNGFQRTPELEALTAQAGLQHRLLVADARLPRYVWWEGRLRPVPLTPGQFLFSDLLSWAGKWGVLRELAVPRMDEAREETVSEFFYRRFGEEMLNRLVDPFVSGVYAGDPGQLSAEATLGRLVALERTSGSVLRGLLAKRSPVAPDGLCTFVDGLGELPEALALRLGRRLWLESPLLRLECPDGLWQAQLRHRGQQVCLLARSVLLSTPAFAAAEVVSHFDAQMARALSSIFYPPVAVVSLAYTADQIPQPLEGFGHLIPRSQSLRSLGSIWNCSLFAHRAPSGWRQFTCFVGGTTDTASAGLSDAELEMLVHRDLQTVLGVQGKPRPLSTARWQRAIPQYALGHEAKRTRLLSRLADWPGLFLSGSYFGGVSLGSCVREAFVRSGEIERYLAGVGEQTTVRPA
jgi:oxygen-dependent protoporphyrinogen oxidase